MTKKAMLKLPLKGGLKYLAKECYQDGITFSNWKENLLTAAANLTRESPKFEVVKNKADKPIKKAKRI